jgi:hydroxypyruvate reductase/glycerate 2-kinase
MHSKANATQIFYDALEAVKPKHFISQFCELKGNILSIAEDRYDLNSYHHIYLFGSGKAAITMAKEMEKLLGDRIHDGLIVVPEDSHELKYVKVCESSHPLPTDKSIQAAKKLMTMMQSCREDDLYIYLLSGGSSALIELPIEPISLSDLQETTYVMLQNALEIQEINSVRKHLSQIKGGRLAQSCKAQGAVLVISDLIDDDLHAIGSAPLYADQSSYAEAKTILENRQIWDLMPNSVTEVLDKGYAGLIPETPKKEKAGVKHYIIASNTQALQAAQKSAHSLGYKVKIAPEPMSGDVETMLEKMIELSQSSDENCILFGGECTVKVMGSGQGGRNQHAVLLMLKQICDKGLDICFLSASTDGVDGFSDAAGAVVDKQSCHTLPMASYEKHLKNFDSYNFFKYSTSLIETGASGTNVIDIAIIIKEE